MGQYQGRRQPQKTRYQLRACHISFELAIEAFADPQGVYLADRPHSIGEERMQYVGQLGGDIVVLIVFTERAAIRIISARKASKKEQKIYVDANG